LHVFLAFLNIKFFYKNSKNFQPNLHLKIMELGISFSEFLFFLILSAFLCLVVILPSDAMQSAGFTISKVFAFWLGDERFFFIFIKNF